ncbi:MAG: hypothetical protein HKO13_00280 [Sphingomonas sp.]|nr:hypothetical protein [Sphingomonas sp.]
MVGSTLVAMLTLGACASTPPIKVTYFQPQATLKVKVIETLACRNDVPFSIASAILTPEYEAGDNHHSFNLDDLDGPLSNTDAEVQFYDDGRLKSINATSTGVGPEILSAALKLPLPVSLAKNVDKSAQDANKAMCNAIALEDPKGKVVNLNYGGTLVFGSTPPNDAVATILEPNNASVQLAGRIGYSFVEPVVNVVYVAPTSVQRIQHRGTEAKDPYLKLLHPSVSRVEVGHVAFMEARVLTRAQMRVPQWGREYMLPLPKAVWAGEQKLSLTLSPGGEVTSFGAKKTTGTAAVLGSITETYDRFNQTDSEEAAAINAETDVLAAHARRVRCESDPAACE